MTSYLHWGGDVLASTIAHELAEPAAVVITRSLAVRAAQEKHLTEALEAETRQRAGPR